MLDDSILDHHILSYEAEETLKFENIAEEMQKAGMTFPSKMTFDEPEIPTRISYSNGFFYVEGIRGMFKTLEQAYDHVRSAKNCGAVFDESVRELPDIEGGFLDEDGITMNLPNGMQRIFFGPTDNTNLDAAKYRQYLMTAKEWLTNQDDWLMAYSFIEDHPIFWHRSRPEEFPNQWNTSEGHNGMWVAPARNDKGEVVVMLEHGRSKEPAHQYHYHDPRLDVWGSSFEDAYIQMAKKIHKYFTVDGDERENVDYTPQQWEVELAQRISELPESLSVQIKESDVE